MQKSAVEKKTTGQDLFNAEVYSASQWKLMWWKFRKHKLANVSGILILLMYLLAVTAQFVAPYDPYFHDRNAIYIPPQIPRWFDDEGFSFRPFVYGYKNSRDPETLRLIQAVDKSERRYIHFFVRGYEYKFLGLFKTDRHLFGTDQGRIHLLGTDNMGRDLFSRIVYGARISLTIGLLGVILSLFMGVTIGGFSGYYGGIIDSISQRLIELLQCIPAIPLWMILSTALPPHWSSIKIYFGVTIILSFIGWTGLARVVRSKFLSLREEEFVLAASLYNANNSRIVFRHMIPSFTSHIIASVSLSIPHMILGETALSFLGLGLRPPAISWGVLLQGAQNVRTVAHAPWLLLPGVAVIIVVLCFNFLGDGIRDAADPYGRA